MSIRCSELSIPAVIGCGEQIFSDLLNKKEIQITVKIKNPITKLPAIGAPTSLINANISIPLFI